ncbi:MAG TPA: hypothetical protein VFS52_05325 [Steroidobacteraceae bacterium]|nr:hypothetical protein [Steroidobacteraceae bacterium]
MHVRFPMIGLICGMWALAGCGGDGNGDGFANAFTTQILSDSRFDGDIEQTGPDTFTVTQGMSSTVQSVLVGIDPDAGTEFRAFLDFPLGGANGVPADAVIDSAFLEIFIDDLLPITGKLPVRVDLVAFQPPTLIETDFNRTSQPALASVIVTPDIDRRDVGTLVPIDVTSLMIEAQRRGLVDFQVRIMQDLGPAIPVLMVIDDTTGPNRSQRAPLLTVTYF